MTKIIIPVSCELILGISFERDIGRYACVCFLVGGPVGKPAVGRGWDECQDSLVPVSH